MLLAFGATSATRSPWCTATDQRSGTAQRSKLTQISFPASVSVLLVLPLLVLLHYQWLASLMLLTPPPHRVQTTCTLISSSFSCESRWGLSLNRPWPSEKADSNTDWYSQRASSANIYWRKNRSALVDFSSRTDWKSSPFFRRAHCACQLGHQGLPSNTNGSQSVAQGSAR